MRKNGELNKVFSELVAPEWEIQKHEKPHMFEYFRVYRDLKSTRNYSILATALGYEPNTPEHKAFTAKIRHISFRYSWEERLRAYEKWIDKEIIANNLKEREAARSRQRDAAKEVHTALRVPVKKWLKKVIENKVNFDNISDKDLFSMVLRATQGITSIGEFERKLNGEATEFIKQEVEHTGKIVVSLPDKMLKEPDINLKPEESNE